MVVSSSRHDYSETHVCMILQHLGFSSISKTTLIWVHPIWLVDAKMGLCDTEPLQPLPMTSPWIFSASCEGPRFSKARIVGAESLEASDSLGPKDSAMGCHGTIQPRSQWGNGPPIPWDVQLNKDGYPGFQQQTWKKYRKLIIDAWMVSLPSFTMEYHMRPPLEYVCSLFPHVPTDRLLGGFNPDNKGISTNQPISMVQTKENQQPPGPCWRVLVQLWTNCPSQNDSNCWDVDVWLCFWKHNSDPWTQISWWIFWTSSIDRYACGAHWWLYRSWPFFDMSADAPLILGQFYVLFKMSGWSWTTPKIGGS